MRAIRSRRQLEVGLHVEVASLNDPMAGEQGMPGGVGGESGETSTEATGLAGDSFPSFSCEDGALHFQDFKPKEVRRHYH